MPPPLRPESEAEESGSDDLDTIPAKPTKATKKKSAKALTPESEIVEDAANGANEDREEDDEEDGETFAVEKILAHDFGTKGVVLYHVKWLGYEDESDLTWEPAANLIEGAQDILEEYHKKIGGAPTPKPKGGRGKRKAVSTTSSPAPAAPAARAGRPTKKAKANGEWKPPVGSWEDEVESIQTISDDIDDELNVFMLFNDGHKSKHPMSLVRQKCPQKLLDYYEQHLTFKDAKGQDIDADI
ncbi:chromo-domain-containing protein [Myriangium duriaei CBS 260.36]|uniref:Chromo-domain-containing protein n=1 Tax=Myriangium duriaei CBS 260.36 TaxID=1168546 RepID=A0A9P4MH95_9PEZI|nr:chromo-domain-containing protein [Myriangium duriaei CBS 260.36]